MVPFTDISKWQGAVDFQRMVDNHVAGVLIRAGNGITTDRMCDRYVAGARAAGLKVGLYWFCNPKVSSGVHQGQLLAAAHARHRPDVRPMLDVEDYSGEAGPGGSIPAPQFATWLRGMAAEVAKTCTPLIYTNGSYWNAHVGASDFGHLDLICARYPFYSPAACAAHVPPVDARDWDEWIMAETSKRPQVPSGWDTWDAWQFSAGFNGRGHVYGVSSIDLDLNIARDDAWARWHAHAPIDPPEVIDPPVPPVPPILEDYMPRFIQPSDGDTAVFVQWIDGTCTWVPNSATLNQVIADGIVTDPTRHPVHRDSLQVMHLAGTSPVYAPGYTGPRTTDADFAGCC